MLQGRDARFEVDEAGGTLTINDVRLDDEGNYVCVVNTTAQPVVTSTNAHLYVESETASSCTRPIDLLFSRLLTSNQNSRSV